MSQKPSSPVYLDFQATTPIDPDVASTIHSTLLEAWANPSSGHVLGKAAKAALDTARQQVADLLSAPAADIIFTSGGTEANNWVIHSILDSPDTPDRPHIISCAVEHDSVLHPLQYLADTDRIDLTLLDVDQTTGLLDPQAVLDAVTPTTALVSLMLANNETGNIHPLKDISALLRKHTDHRIFLHTDAAQAIGKIPVQVDNLGVDYLTVVGHKFYGPRIGALYVRDLDSSSSSSPPLSPMLRGGGQERGLRSGTENVAMCAGLGHACQLVTENLSEYADAMQTTRDYLEERLSQAGVRFALNSNRDNRLPNTANISLLDQNDHPDPSLAGHALLPLLEPSLICSTGSACHAGSTSVSRVLLATGIPTEHAVTSLRISTGRTTTLEDIELAVAAIAKVCESVARNSVLVQ